MTTTPQYDYLPPPDALVYGDKWVRCPVCAAFLSFEYPQNRRPGLRGHLSFNHGVTEPERLGVVPTAQREAVALIFGWGA